MSTGVIIGRFQVPELHSGHEALIQHVQARHKTVVILLGVTLGGRSFHNPLKYEERLSLFEQYPQFAIFPLMDQPSNEIWSDQVDRLLSQFADPVLYGSRDSFLPSYQGKYPKEYYHPEREQCGRLIRRSLVREKSLDFRRGLIYAQKDRFPISYQTVDIAVVRNSSQILLGKKKGLEGWRFPGGFVDPSDVSLERAALRELHEEVGEIEVGKPRYVGSFRIKDYRYRGAEDQILSALFEVPFQWGLAKAGDDLSEVKWVERKDLLSEIGEIHKEMAQSFLGGDDDIPS